MNVKLTVPLAEVVFAIDQAMPRGLTLHELKSRLWGHLAEERSDNTLKVYISQARSVLGAFGYTIPGINSGPTFGRYRILPIDLEGTKP